MAKKISDEIREWGYGFCGDTYDVVTAIADRIDAEMVELPKSADGETIHIGDVMEWDNGTFTVHELKVTEDGWTTWDEQHGYTVHTDETHHHEPTVEDVLIKMLEKAVGYSDAHTTVALNAIAEYAAKLRLADNGKEQQ